MIGTIVLLIIALTVLALSAKLLISNSIILARFLKISELAVGFLLVSVATSLPELLVSIYSGVAGETGLAIGNVFGSNIANICIVLGLSAFLAGELAIKRREVRDLVKILFLTTAIPIVMLIFPEISIYGVILLAVFLLYTYYILKKEVGLEAKPGKRVSSYEALKSGILFLASILIIILSSKYAVDYAVQIADGFGIAKSFVGATIVAVGTSLPEIAVSLSAIAKKKVSLALGNVIGSSITNLTLVLGTAAVLNPLVAKISIFANLVFFSLLVNLLLWNFIGEDHKISRRDAIVLLGVYVLFVVTMAGIEIAF